MFNLGTLAAWPGQAVLCWQHDSTTEALEVGPLVTESAESAHSCYALLILEVFLMMCTHIRGVFNVVHLYNGASFHGAPFVKKTLLDST